MTLSSRKLNKLDETNFNKNGFEKKTHFNTDAEKAT